MRGDRRLGGVASGLGVDGSHGVPLPPRHRARARSSRASTSPTARPRCAASSRRRASTSSRCAAEGRACAAWSACAAGVRRRRIVGPRVSGLQPGAGDAAEGRHAARCSRSTSCASSVPNPVFKAVLDDVHEKVRGGTALSDAFAAHGDLFPPIYTASLMAGEKSGNLEQVLRRFVAYTQVVDARASERDLGAHLSGGPVALALVAGRHHRGQVVPAFRSSTAASAPSCRWPRGSSRRLERRRAADPARSPLARGRRRRASPGRGCSSRGPTRAVRSRWCCACPASGTVHTSSRPRSWRARWRRCSAAASRW